MPFHPPLTDPEFLTLLPFLDGRSPRGRPLSDLRNRLDAIFHIAGSADPWRTLPARFGNPDTVSRWFRRLTRTGFWSTLLEAIPRAAPDSLLRALAPRICRACRRAARLLGLRFILRIRQLGLLMALPGPPPLVANPILSETLDALRFPTAKQFQRMAFPAIRTYLRARRALHSLTGGRVRLARWQRLAWS